MFTYGQASVVLCVCVYSYVHEIILYSRKLCAGANFFAKMPPEAPEEIFTVIIIFCDKALSCVS